MEAATKNKKGRPKNKEYEEARILNNNYSAYNTEIGNRALQNTVNAQYFLTNLINEERSDIELFFMTSEGNLRRKGIAEQIGRMLREGLIDQKTAEQIADEAIKLYNAGRSSKQIEAALRRRRQKLKEGGLHE